MISHFNISPPTDPPTTTPTEPPTTPPTDVASFNGLDFFFGILLGIFMIGLGFAIFYGIKYYKCCTSSGGEAEPLLPRA